MGLNASPPPPRPDEPSGGAADDGRASLLEDLAVYALDAIDPDEALRIETRLATDPDATALESSLRIAAATMAAARDGIDVEPPVDLRDRVLTAAHARRPPVAVEAATMVDVHRIEVERAVMLFRRLRAEQWEATLDPPEFEGWSVHDIAVHLASNETLAAISLGAVPADDEVLDNETRTARSRARAREGAVPPAAAVDELEHVARLVDDHVRALGADDLHREVTYWGASTPIASMLAIRSFETWTHADDVRRALGLAHVPPPATSVAAMSQLAVTWTPLMLAMHDKAREGVTVQFELTGHGGGTYHVPAGLEPFAVDEVQPAAVFRIDVVDYCRALADRVPLATMPYTATGDLELAADVAASLNSLAVL